MQQRRKFKILMTINNLGIEFWFWLNTIYEQQAVQAHEMLFFSAEAFEQLWNAILFESGWKLRLHTNVFKLLFKINYSRNNMSYSMIFFLEWESKERKCNQGPGHLITIMGHPREHVVSINHTSHECCKRDEGRTELDKITVRES